jgi:hypothetical protein
LPACRQSIEAGRFNVSGVVKKEFYVPGRNPNIISSSGVAVCEEKPKRKCKNNTASRDRPIHLGAKERPHEKSLQHR